MTETESGIMQQPEKVHLTMPAELCRRLDTFRRSFESPPSRPKGVLLLMERGLAVESGTRSRRRASEPKAAVGNEG